MNLTMRAVRLHETLDGKNELRLDHDVPVPVLNSGEVLLAVRACGLNQVDLLTRDGQTPQPPPLPHISGTEVAGDVVDVGPGVRGWKSGDRVVVDPIWTCGHCTDCQLGKTNMCRNSRVLGVQTPGGYADYVVVPASQIMSLPSNLSYAQAAAAAVTGPTAWHMLRRRADIRIGEDVLILAGGSGIGVLGIQIAALSGARVIATAGSEEKMRQAKELGADFVVNHSSKDWADHVRKITNGRGVDVVFEHVGEATWDNSLRALARGGRLVTCGCHTGPHVAMNLWHLFVKEFTLIGSFAGSRQDFLDVFRMLEQGSIKQVIQQTLALDEVVKAQYMLEGRQVFGKLILDPTLPLKT